MNANLASRLAAAAGAGAVPWGMLLTVLLQRFPGADAPCRAAKAMHAERGLRRAGDSALQAAWRWLERGAGDYGPGELGAAVDEARRQALLLDRLGQEPAQRRRANALQSSLRNAWICRLEQAVRAG